MIYNETYQYGCGKMKKERKPVSIRWQLIIVNVIVVIITLIAGTAISLTYYVNTMEQQLESELHTVAFMLSKTETVIETLKANQASEELNAYIDEILAGNTEINVITVADMTGKRVYHIDKEKSVNTLSGAMMMMSARENTTLPRPSAPSATNSDIFIPFSMKKTSKSVL